MRDLIDTVYRPGDTVSTNTHITKTATGYAKGTLGFSQRFWPNAHCVSGHHGQDLPGITNMQLTKPRLKRSRIDDASKIILENFFQSNPYPNREAVA